MKTLNTLAGGYPRNQDYLLTLQSELITMNNSIFGSISFDVVLSGCAVTDNHDGTVSIAAGIVYLNGQVLRFDGASNIAADGSKVITTGSPVASTPLTFHDLGVKNVYTETKGIVANAAGDNARQLVIGLSLLTFEGYIDARIAGSAVKGMVREFSFSAAEADEITAFKAKFDDTGLGITPDMLDWALMNGNNDTVDAQGRTFVGAGKITDPITGIEHVLESGAALGEYSHKIIPGEAPTPAGLITGIIAGAKPSDGGGPSIAWVTGRSVAANALSSLNLIQPSVVVFKIRKIR